MSVVAQAHWDSLLDTVDAAALCSQVTEGQRARRLRFGDRVLCPFLRPFFLDAADEARVKRVAEALWVLGERVARVAIDAPDMLRQLALSEAEIRLARIDPGYATTSTAARADAFILPDTLQFAEYNGESPAGAAYSQGLAELFDGEPLMARFRERFDARFYRPVGALLEALVASYREWGGTASPPLMAIVDWREVPTYSEFEILRDAFTALGVPTIICDPRDLEYIGPAKAGHSVPGDVAVPRDVASGSGENVVSGGSRQNVVSGGHGENVISGGSSQNVVSGFSRTSGLYAQGRRIDLVYRRVLINDIVAREAECRALVDAYAQRAVCVANSLRCKIPHKKAFFAVLTDERHAGLFSAEEQDLIRRHIPWTAVVEERSVTRDGARTDLVTLLRDRRDRFVIKPNDEYGGTGVTLGWETSESDWDAAIARALAERDRGWVAQERIAVRREPFPVCDGDAPRGARTRDMLVDFAPYVFRGRLAGFLTRLSATGLANVTSGGGQVPAFVVSRKSEF